MTDTGLIFLIMVGLSVIVLIGIYLRKKIYLYSAIVLLFGVFLFVANIGEVVSNFGNNPISYVAQMVPALIGLVLGSLMLLGTYFKSKRKD